MNQKNTKIIIESFLKTNLSRILPKHSISDAYNYAMFPAGKLFRPQIALSTYTDLDSKGVNELSSAIKNDILSFCCALECHHSYTLVHDDLPSMDNDDYRRGKLSTHKKYGEWQAILIGDGLLNVSYEFLTKIKNANPIRHLELLKLFTWALGPKGLIQGQVLDLSTEMTESFANTIETHKLKTARLIQVAMLGATLLACDKNRNFEKKIWKFSLNIGILFQLIDDLTEMCDEKLSTHEMAVNPWIKFTEKTQAETLDRLKKCLIQMNELNLKNTNEILIEYFNKMNEQIKKNEKQISINLNNQIELTPIMRLLDSICTI